MDKQQQMAAHERIIAKVLRRVARQSYWLAAAIGFLFGLIAGAAIGYSLGSPQTIFIPLEPGTSPRLQ